MADAFSPSTRVPIDALSTGFFSRAPKLAPEHQALVVAYNDVTDAGEVLVKRDALAGDKHFSGRDVIDARPRRRQEIRREARLHAAGQAYGERLHRVIQRSAARRVPERQ